MEVNEYSQNYGDGWIKIFRSIRKHWIWKDAEKLKCWIDILLEVNHADTKVAFGYTILECKRGQSLNSISTWAKRWNVSKKAAYNFLKMLSNDSMVVLESERVSTRLTVCNYDDYQFDRNAVWNGTETRGKREGITNNNKKNILYSEEVFKESNKDILYNEILPQ